MRPISQNLSCSLLKYWNCLNGSRTITSCNFPLNAAAACSTRKRAVKLCYTVYQSTKPVDSNNASPILILHGLFGSKTNWHSLSKAILAKTGRKVVAVDARNHGESPHSFEFTFDVMKDDLLLLMDDLKIPKATLIGHSMGGRTVMAAALSEPDYVDGLVVVDISPFTLSPSSGFLHKYATALKKIDFPPNVPLSKARKMADEELKATVPEAMVRQFLLTNIYEGPDKTIKWRVNLDAIAEQIDGIFSFPEQLSSYDGPTLFIGGGESDYIRRDEHDLIKQKLFPKAEFEYIEGAGHWVHSQKPEQFLKVLIKFLSSM